MNYGFDKAKKPIEPVAPVEKKLDLTGLDMPPPAVTTEQEAAAVARGDALGFGSREGLAPESARYVSLPEPARPLGPARQRRAIPTKSVLVKGPKEVMDRFITYTNESGAGAYWEAIDGLLKAKGR
jgi:hypothetical protein